jgi:hypothetical protein
MKWGKLICGALWVAGLASLSVGADEAWDREARFSVSSIVVNENPGPWTATMGEGPANSLIYGGAFEPIVLRRKWHALADSANEVVVRRADIEGYDSWRDGLFDGATVRIYRIVNGNFVKVREDTIANHFASDWILPEGFRENEVLAPSATQATLNFPGWYRHDDDYWFKVVAVDEQGNESADSEYVQLRWNGWLEEQGRMTNEVVSFSAPATPTEVEAPGSPAGFSGSYDPQSGLMTFRWNAVPAADLAGYRLYMCDREPSTLNGFHLFLSESPADTNLHVRAGDILFMEKTMMHFDREVYLSNRLYGTHVARNPPLVPFHNSTNEQWALVPHPGPVPAELQVQGGQSCLALTVNHGETIRLAQYNYAHLQQNWYQVLDTNKTYVVEVWLRQEGLSDPTVSFSLNAFYSGRIPATDFTVTGAWQKFTTTFSPQEIYEGPGSVGQMLLSFAGPGSLWVDNFRVYEQGTGYLDFPAADYTALAESGMGFLRTHSHIKSDFGYTMEMFTNPRGVMGSRGWSESGSEHTLESLLSIMDAADINPWLQIEMYMSEAEWLGWVEYMAAPYDPGSDTPQSKPWAFKRYAQGHAEPWTARFDRILFEISNETWNGLFSPWTFLGYQMDDAATGRRYSSGELYGLWQEYVIGILRSSPYWTADVESRFEFVLGGWMAQRNEGGYGQQAAALSPSSQHMTLAGYNGGWDEGEPPAAANDETRFKTLAFAVQAAEPRARELADTLEAQRRAAGIEYALGTYEAGPGYNLNGLNGVSMTEEQVEAESQVMKSLVGGTATLDSFLMRAMYGFDLQNFFTYHRNRHYWVSHARWENGGQAYPCWSALSLYNRYATGDFLLVRQESSPSYNLPQTPQRSALNEAPMTAVYATRKEDQFGVFCISRKMAGFPFAESDGYTPMTVDLPFQLSSNATITLYKLTGDPRVHNLETNHVDIVSQAIPTHTFSTSFSLNTARGADDRGLPPASVYLYLFDGVIPLAEGSNCTVRIQLKQGTETPSLELPVDFEVAFSHSIDPASFTVDDIQFDGDGGASHVEIVPVPYTANAEYLIRINGASTLGTLLPRIEAARVVTAAGGSNLVSTYHGEPFILGIPPAGGSYQFIVTDDTKLSNYDPGPHGADTSLTTLGYFYHGWGDRILLKFPTLPDLGDRLPDSAEVQLYAYDAVETTNDHFHVLLDYPVDWDEESYVISLEDAYNLVHRSNVVSVARRVQQEDQWHGFDCTAHVIQKLRGDRTLSMAFDISPLGSTSGFWRWYSKEHDNGNYAPRLLLRFGSESYGAWKQQYQLTGSMEADDDADGRTNFEEFSLGGNPTNALDRGLFSWNAHSNALELVHAQRRDGAAAYTVEGSTNLLENSWYTQGVIRLPAASPLDDTYDAVTNRLMNEAARQQFLRLRIQ